MPCLFSCFVFSKHKKPTSSSDPRCGDHKALLQAKKLEIQEPVETQSDEVKLEEQRVKCNIGNENVLEELPGETISDELIRENGGKEGKKNGEEEERTRVVVVVESNERKGRQLVPESIDSLKEDLAVEGLEEADGEKGRDFVIEESSDSLFSLSIDSRKRVSEVDFDYEREVTSPISKKESVSGVVEFQLNRNAQVLKSGLNQIKNGTDQKTVKVSKETLQEDYEKENIRAEFESQCQESNKKKLADEEITVDTSLSSWLVESSGGNSVENSETKKGRGSLRELNLQEQTTEFVCGSKSNARDPNSVDVPLLGTIGSYWSCTKQSRNRTIAI